MGDQKDAIGMLWDGDAVGIGRLPSRSAMHILPVRVPTIDFVTPNVKKAQTAWSWRNLFSPPATDPVTQGFSASSSSIRDSSTVADYLITRAAAASSFTDYITVRINGRNTGQTTTPVVYRFLINPHTISVNRNQVDAQSMTRAGWQVGCWGDDIIEIHLEGVTAGQYFTLGLTNNWSEYSYSYANFAQLLTLFENNGYWFEGEGMDTSALAGDVFRTRIRYHSDVELRVGNFIWRGCFTDMEVTEDAEKPYQLSFSLNFMAWKERFTTSSL